MRVLQNDVGELVVAPHYPYEMSSVPQHDLRKNTTGSMHMHSCTRARGQHAYAFVHTREGGGAHAREGALAHG